MATGERRRSARATVQRGGIIEPLTERGLRKPVQIVDVSAQGAQFVAGRGVAVGTRVRIEAFPSPDRSGSSTIEFSGRVVRVTEHGKATAMGVAFDQPNLPVVRVRPEPVRTNPDDASSKARGKSGAQPISRPPAQISAAQPQRRPSQHLNVFSVAIVLAACIALFLLMLRAPQSNAGQNGRALIASKNASHNEIVAVESGTKVSGEATQWPRGSRTPEKPSMAKSSPRTGPDAGRGPLFHPSKPGDSAPQPPAEARTGPNTGRAPARENAADTFASDSHVSLPELSSSPFPGERTEQFAERSDAFAGRQGPIVAANLRQYRDAGNSAPARRSDSRPPSGWSVPNTSDVYWARFVGHTTPVDASESALTSEPAHLGNPTNLRGMKYVSASAASKSRRYAPVALRKFAGDPISIFADLSDHTLSVAAFGTITRTFRVGIGSNRSTPTGNFTVINKILDPNWYNRGRSVKAGDPANPLGKHWLGLADDTGKAIPVGIHATSEVGAIGESTSRGCIRLTPGDAEAVFRLCPAGTHVIISQ